MRDLRIVEFVKECATCAHEVCRVDCRKNPCGLEINGECACVSPAEDTEHTCKYWERKK